MLEEYRKHVEERAEQGIPPKALNAEQVASLVELLKRQKNEPFLHFLHPNNKA